MYDRCAYYMMLYKWKSGITRGNLTISLKRMLNMNKQGGKKIGFSF